jgi:hypothetical protein
VVTVQHVERCLVGALSIGASLPVVVRSYEEAEPWNFEASAGSPASPAFATIRVPSVRYEKPKGFWPVAALGVAGSGVSSASSRNVSIARVPRSVTVRRWPDDAKPICAAPPSGPGVESESVEPGIFVICPAEVKRKPVTSPPPAGERG